MATTVPTSSSESVADLLVPVDVAGHGAPDVEAEVLAHFDRSAPSLYRYARSFGFAQDEAEDIVQEAFLALFRHLRRGRDRQNLRAWLFRVAHNLALKQRRRARSRVDRASWDDEAAAAACDPAPDPETRLVADERRQRLRAVVHALPEREQRCLRLRAEGLTYRDIAAIVHLSLAGVAKALGRAMTRLVNADGG